MSRLKFFSNLNLGLKLNLMVVFVLGVLLATMVVVINRSAGNLTLQTGRQRAAQEVAIIQSRFVEVERELLQSARLLAATSGLIEAVADQDVERIRTLSLVGAAPLDLDDVDIVDSAGKRLVLLNNSADELDAEQEGALISLALLGIDARGTIIEKEANGELALGITVAIPLRDNQGAIVGGLLVNRKMDDEFITGLNFTRSEVELMLVDEAGVLAQIVLENEHHLNTLAETTFLDQTAIRRSLNEETIIADHLISIENAPHAIAYAPLTVGGETQTVIITLVDMSEAVNFQNQLVSTLSILVTILTLGVVGLIAFFVRQTISQPLRVLQQAAERIRSGDYSEPAPVNNRDEVGQLALGLNEMAEAILTREGTLQDLTRNLERQSQGLAANAEISQHLLTLLDQTQLLAAVVEQIQTTFNYYHTHIYLLDESRERLVMAEGAGSAGAAMKAGGHHILLNAPTSLVARAARSGHIVRVDNVRETADWLPNPLLPDTQAEMAVPVILNDQVVGVLDVQADEVGGLDDSDASLLASLANQVAVAIRNARLFNEVETALAEAQDLQARYVQQSWAEVRQKGQGGAYLHSRSDELPPDETFIAALEEEVEQQSQPVVVGTNGADTQGSAPVVAPIKLQDELLGVIQLHQLDDAQPREWRERDLALVEAVANQVAQVAENLRLFEETQERAGREATIREITDKVRAAPNLDALLEVAARELGQQLGVRRAALEIGIEAEDSRNGNGSHG